VSAASSASAAAATSPLCSTPAGTRWRSTGLLRPSPSITPQHVKILS
jgi:hypothetical protein